MDLLLLSTFPLPFLDHLLPWLNSWSSRAGQLHVESVYFPRAGALRETDGYGLLVQSGTAASKLPQAGQSNPSWELSGPSPLTVKKKRSRMTGYGSLRFQISLLAAKEAQCHAHGAYIAQPQRDSRVVNVVEV
jgi:hypothetical protein